MDVRADTQVHTGAKTTVRLGHCHGSWNRTYLAYHSDLLFQIQLDCHGDVISSGFMYTDSLVVEVAPVVSAALTGCKYSVKGIREKFLAAAESTTDAARLQVQDVGAWLEDGLDNI